MIFDPDKIKGDFRKKIPTLLIIMNFVSILTALFATGTAEFLQGRTFLGASKSLELITFETDGPLTSQAMFDPYSLTHFEHGLYYSAIIRLLGLSSGPYIALAVESLWEIFENSNWGIEKYRTAGYTYSGDSIINSLLDILSMALGYYVAETYLSTTATIVLALGMDWVLYRFFNDSFIQTFLKFFHKI